MVSPEKTRKKKIVISSGGAVDNERYRKELNEPQYRAVMHAKGPALVIAGAGSGKTRALTYRVAYLLEKGVPPASIVLVTFTKKAAQEMIRRVRDLAGAKADRIIAGTFHHIANMYLRKYAKILGFGNNFTVLDRQDQLELMKRIRNSWIERDKQLKESESAEKSSRLGLPAISRKYPKSTELIRIYSLFVNTGTKIDEILKEKFPDYINLADWINRVIADFKAAKKEYNVMDFDDLMIYFLEFLVKSPASSKLTKSIKHVLVDEYQDVNLIQARIVEELSRDAESVMVVGDDAQAIYSFRGADVGHMLKFPEIFPDCKKYMLDINYRSTPEILNLANASIAHNKKQYLKNLKPVKEKGELPWVLPTRSPEQEADLIAHLVLQNREDGVPFHEQAVLFRAKYHSIYVEHALMKNKIPYEVRAGMRFFESAHVKDLLAYLMILVNPSDKIQWQRILEMHEGVGPTAARKVIGLFKDEDPMNELEQFVSWDLNKVLKGKNIRKIGKESMAGLQKLFRENFIDSKGRLKPEDKLPPVSEIILRLHPYLLPIFKKRYADKGWEDRSEEIKELANFTHNYRLVSEFLDDILTQMDVVGKTERGGKTEEERPLVLSTIHQAKGLEWDVVYIINLVDGRFPAFSSLDDPDQLEEERRLFYVAATRARKMLYLTYPEFIGQYNNDVLSTKSLFLREIEDDDVYEVIEVEYE